MASSSRFLFPLHLPSQIRSLSTPPVSRRHTLGQSPHLHSPSSLRRPICPSKAGSPLSPSSSWPSSHTAQSRSLSLSAPRLSREPSPGDSTARSSQTRSECLPPSASHELADPPRSPPRSPLWSRTSPSLSHLSFSLGSDPSRSDPTRYAIGCTTPTSRPDPSQSRLIRARSTLLHADPTPSNTGSDPAATFLASSPLSCTQFVVRSTPISRSRTFLLSTRLTRSLNQPTRLTRSILCSTHPTHLLPLLTHSTRLVPFLIHSTHLTPLLPHPNRLLPYLTCLMLQYPLRLYFLPPPNLTDVPTQQTSLETHF